jgi:hypothetical protein
VRSFPSWQVIGGYSASDGWLSSVEALAADGSGWSHLPPMAAPRCYAAAALLPSGHVVVAGGRCGNGNAGIVQTVEQWDPATEAWGPLPPMSHPRRCAAGCMLPSGKFAVIGGKDGEGQRREDGAPGRPAPLALAWPPWLRPL